MGNLVFNTINSKQQFICQIITPIEIKLYFCKNNKFASRKEIIFFSCETIWIIGNLNFCFLNSQFFWAFRQFLIFLKISKNDKNAQTVFPPKKYKNRPTREIFTKILRAIFHKVVRSYAYKFHG